MQGKLFDLTHPDMPAIAPICHTHDPSTSKEAAAKHTASGKRSRNIILVLRMLERSPGVTACELWENAYTTEKMQLVEMQEVRRRLVDLERAGQVRKAGKRLCRVKNNNQSIWEPVIHG